MVATTATTPPAHATGCLPTSAPPPPRSTALRSTPPPFPTWDDSTPDALSSLLPPPTLTDRILDDLAVPQFSLAIVAMKHGLTLSGMLTWLNLPETREVLALRESAAYAHARHVAALNIGHAVETVASIVRDYNTTGPAREAQDRKTPGSAHRSATNARKAAWLLLQFARIVPVNEADLRHATGCLPASAKHNRSTPSRAHRTANVSEHASSSASPLPSQRVHPAGVLPDLPLASSLKDDANSTANVSARTSSSDASLLSPTLHAAGALPDLPLASSLKDDANFPRVACLLEEQACSESESAENHATGCLSASANSRTPVPSKSASDFDALPDSPLVSPHKTIANSLDPPAPVPRPTHAA